MYYPKSQIVPNLYTEGGEYLIVNTGLAYTGYYFKTSNGKYFTGRNISDKPNQLLIPITKNSEIPIDTDPISEILPEKYGYVTYLSPDPDIPYAENAELSGEVNASLYDRLRQVNSKNLSPRQLPVTTYVKPTSSDYKVGEFRRYFCWKSNEGTFYEVEKGFYDRVKAKDPNVFYELFFVFNFPWTLTGEESEVETINKNIVNYTENRYQFKGLHEYLNFEYLKFYRG